MTTRTRTRPHRPVPLLAALACLAAMPAAAAGMSAGTVAPDAWSAAHAAIFRVFAALPGFPFACTGWYAAPAQGRPPVSVYITAGHCPAPLMVRTGEGLEDTLVIARLHSAQAGADLTIGERADPRTRRVYLPLAAAPPIPGERALVAGYAGGELTTLIATADAACQRPFVCFTSDAPIRGGLSGSPIVSLRTGEVLGILVAASRDQQAPDGPHAVLATPASAILAALRLALPAALPAQHATRVP
jgi:hypothetical protein